MLSVNDLALQYMCPATMRMEVGVQLTDAIEYKQHCNLPIQGNHWVTHAAMAMWPNIAFATSYWPNSAKPCQVHWEVAKQVVRYLKTTHNLNSPTPAITHHRWLLRCGPHIQIH